MRPQYYCPTAKFSLLVGKKELNRLASMSLMPSYSIPPRTHGPLLRACPLIGGGTHLHCSQAVKGSLQVVIVAAGVSVTTSPAPSCTIRALPLGFLQET